MRTIFLPEGITLLFFALAIAVLPRLLTPALRADTAFLGRVLPFAVRRDLSLVAANLPLLFALRLIVALLAPIDASSYVVSQTLTLLILFRFHLYLMYNP